MYADKYNIPWNGRVYKSEKTWNEQDDIQKAITLGNQLLYNVCHCAVLMLGFSPTIGFIHTGTMRSFVYDLADLYKADIVIPTAFEIASSTSSELVESKMRERCREKMEEYKLWKRIITDMKDMFGSAKEDKEMKTELWNGKEGTVKAGYNFSNNMAI